MVSPPPPEITISAKDNFMSPRGDLDHQGNSVSGRVSRHKMTEISQGEQQRRGGGVDHTNSHRELLKIKLDHKHRGNIPKELEEFNNQDLNPPVEKPGNL